MKPPKSVQPQSIHQSWYLKVNSIDGRTALWLRFSLFESRNGFKRAGEICGIVFRRNEGRDVTQVALKQTTEVESFSGRSIEDLRIGTCRLDPTSSQGVIQNKNQELKWDLRFRNASPDTAEFNLVPPSVRKLKLLKLEFTTPFPNLIVDGVTEINGERIEWKSAVGMIGHRSEPLGIQNSLWSHCNSFVDESGKQAPLVFEGLTVRPKISGLKAPKISAFFLMYRGKEYRFTTLWDVFHSRSESDLKEWRFRAEHGDLAFKGHLKAEYRDFAGLTLEDTRGSLSYGCYTQLAELTIWVYQRGKREGTFLSLGTASFELIASKKNPYVTTTL